MRLRQLGSTQSVTFFAPPEVYQSIMHVCKLWDQGQSVTSAHVVRWLLEQTCRANEQLQGLYAGQGSDFCRRLNAQWTNPRLFTEKSHRKSLLKAIRYPEANSLGQLYGGVPVPQHGSRAAKMSFAILNDFMKEIHEQQSAARARQGATSTSLMEEVEQEREVEFCVEEVRQVQQPTKYRALSFPGLHDSIRHFVKTGSLRQKVPWKQVFDALAETSVGKQHEIRGTASRLFVSEQFMRTVEIKTSGESSDGFLVSKHYCQHSTTYL